MTQDTLLPISERPPRPALPRGRSADLIASGFAACGLILSLIAALWFFFGFAENDTRPEHLLSALVLTTLLFSFAVIPFGIVTELCRRAYRQGASKASYLWTLLLMLPWIGLSIVAMKHTPLPIWCGVLIGSLAVILTLWALVSLAIDRKILVHPKAAEAQDTSKLR